MTIEAAEALAVCAFCDGDVDAGELLGAWEATGQLSPLAICAPCTHSQGRRRHYMETRGRDEMNRALMERMGDAGLKEERYQMVLYQQYGLTRKDEN